MICIVLVLSDEGSLSETITLYCLLLIMRSSSDRMKVDVWSSCDCNVVDNIDNFLSVVSAKRSVLIWIEFSGPPDFLVLYHLNSLALSSGAVDLLLLSVPLYFQIPSLNLVHSAGERHRSLASGLSSLSIYFHFYCFQSFLDTF